jgi:PAS domain S-box-containing protein
MEKPSFQNAESFLDAIIEQSPHSLCITDNKGTTIRMNQACRELLHGTNDEILGKYNLFEDNVIIEQGFVPLVRRVYEKGERVHFTVHYDTAKVLSVSPKITTMLIIEATISPVLDSNKQVTNAIIQHVDITERKQTEDSLLKSQQFLQQVIDNAPFGAHFYQLRDDGKLILTDTNKAADKILHITHAPLLGKTIEEAFPGLASGNIPSEYKRIACEGTQYSHEQIDYDNSGIRGAFEINAFQTVPNHMAVFFADITKRKQAEAAFAEEAARRRILFEQSPDGILIIDPETLRFLDFNATAHQQLGYTREEFAQLTITDIDAVETKEGTRARIAEVIHKGKCSFETIQRTRHGERRNVYVTAQIVQALDRSFYQCIWRDITEQKQIEEERNKLQLHLAQSQKMESIGQLAGGVAHDFNNMLGVIIGNTDLALDQVPPELPLHSDLEEIRKAAQRSADLTRQLLAFARKQAINPIVLNLNDSISSMLKMLRRLIGEDIDLVWMPEADRPKVMIDPSQLDQILTNLCVNSRDAISESGKITIRTSNVDITEKDCAGFSDAFPGDFVLLSISDDGCGMTADVLPHLFEPFFTTKEVGQGTGLGLATIYGIIRQNEGFIRTISEPGKGSEFQIYLPLVNSIPSNVTFSNSDSIHQYFGETVLLVEDEPALLNMARNMLQRMGFTVLALGNPNDAIQKVKEYTNAIHLLITDVVMPGMNGRDLLACIREIKPEIKCLYMSGYSADIIAHRGILENGVRLIQKPFSFINLRKMINVALEKQ